MVLVEEDGRRLAEFRRQISRAFADAPPPPAGISIG